MAKQLSRGCIANKYRAWILNCSAYCLKGKNCFYCLQLAPEIKKQKNFPQEKRKIPAVPNGTAAHGEAEPHGGHSGPELQRTGRLVKSPCMGLQRPNGISLLCWELLF